MFYKKLANHRRPSYMGRYEINKTVRFVFFISTILFRTPIAKFKHVSRKIQLYNTKRARPPCVVSLV